jgi:hypothetical protein
MRPKRNCIWMKKSVLMESQHFTALPETGPGMLFAESLDESDQGKSPLPLAPSSFCSKQ